MKSTLVTMIVAVWTSLVSGMTFAQTSAREPTSDEAARSAVRSALHFLAKDTFAWREQRKCAACHHGPMFVWAANVAAANGYAVSPSDVEDATRWLTTDASARIFPRQPAKANEPPTLSLATVFVNHALNAAPPDETRAVAGRARVAEHIVASQRNDGSWPSPTGRSPFFGNDAIATRLALLAILESREFETSHALRQAAGRARVWLATQPVGDDHQALVLDLWAATHSRDASASALVASLRKAQQPDGGWRQTKALPSDAFATGQALFALSRANIDARDDAIRGAVGFLVRTQQADGTWPMQSQVDPTTGRPARNLNPIAYAATAWAVLGMASHVSESRAAEPKPRANAECPVGTCPGETESAAKPAGWLRPLTSRRP